MEEIIDYDVKKYFLLYYIYMSVQSSEAKSHYLTNLKSFLDGCRARKNDIEVVTHLSFGDLIKGRFNISSEKHEEFIKLYTKAIKYHRLSILECPTEYNHILIDIDLSGSELKQNGRLYDSVDIKHLLNIYNNSLNRLFDIKKYKFHVFEKPSVKQIDNGVYKDGFHIVIPDIITSYENKFKLRSMVMKQIEECN